MAQLRTANKRHKRVIAISAARAKADKAASSTSAKPAKTAD
ncbi:hypothetical protein [Sphingomonas montanisoli]|nr:hypothetical protein [Sphingomonas montanisoli]